MRLDKHTSLFQKRRFQGFISEILKVIGHLGEKSFFLFQLPWDNQNFHESQTFCVINVVLLTNSPEQFELITSNIREVIKFYNLGDKTFETDLRL